MQDISLQNDCELIELADDVIEQVSGGELSSTVVVCYADESGTPLPKPNLRGGV